jgi:methyl-accepting chemotaxis protein
MADITTASDEQRVGIEQINQAVVQMDGVTQQNAALVEQAASAAQALQDQAQSLYATVGMFRLRASAPVPARVPALSRAAGGRRVAQLAGGGNVDVERF